MVSSRSILLADHLFDTPRVGKGQLENYEQCWCSQELLFQRASNILKVE